MQSWCGVITRFLIYLAIQQTTDLTNFLVSTKKFAKSGQFVIFTVERNFLENTELSSCGDAIFFHHILAFENSFLKIFKFFDYFLVTQTFLHILIEANEHFWSKLLKKLPFLVKNWPKITKNHKKWPSKNVRYIYSCLMSKNPDLANFLLHKKSVSTKKFVKSVFYVIFTVVKSVDYSDL